jgi:hypothetical protein
MGERAEVRGGSFFGAGTSAAPPMVIDSLEELEMAGLRGEAFCGAISKVEFHYLYDSKRQGVFGRRESRDKVAAASDSVFVNLKMK